MNNTLFMIYVNSFIAYIAFNEPRLVFLFTFTLRATMASILLFLSFLFIKPHFIFGILGLFFFWCILLSLAFGIRKLFYEKKPTLLLLLLFQGKAFLIAGIIVALYVLYSASLVPIMIGFSLPILFIFLAWITSIFTFKN